MTVHARKSYVNNLMVLQNFTIPRKSGKNVSAFSCNSEIKLLIVVWNSVNFPLDIIAKSALCNIDIVYY